MKPFSLIYFAVSFMLYLIALPLLVFLSFKKKYKQSIPSRFFLFNNPPFETMPDVWFHVCSLGEAAALRPILERCGDVNIAITTITQTGFKEASRYDTMVRYLPYELFLPFWIKKPKVVVVLEAEFWFMLFSVVKFRGAKLILLNARISDKSVDSYLQFAWFYKRIFSLVDTIFVQSDVDKNRFLALGAKNIKVAGNIKLAAKIKTTKEYPKPQREMIVAGSTHEGEELAVIRAFIEYRKNKESTLAVVPRHPERFNAVFELMSGYAKEYGLTLARFSSLDMSVAFEADMILVDAMGELNNIYAISDTAILGGAFNPNVGGHNPLEPAFFGCKIITGKHFFNQYELMKFVHHVQFVEPTEIYNALIKSQEMPPSIVDEKIDLEIVMAEILEKHKE